MIEFQSTHPSGVRRKRHRILSANLHFNPRTPVGCDYHQSIACRGVGISIHAPQWGATRIIGLIEDHRIDFNPRTPVGCDVAVSCRAVGVWVFQSTHPSGVRLVGYVLSHSMGIFQSTHPSGVRPRRNVRLIFLALISIHAPQWGATRVNAILRTWFLFQSTHPSGVRRRNALCI